MAAKTEKRPTEEQIRGEFDFQVGVNWGMSEQQQAICVLAKLAGREVIVSKSWDKGSMGRVTVRVADEKGDFKNPLVEI